MLVYSSTPFINKRKSAVEIQEVAKDVVKRIHALKYTMKNALATI